MDAKRTLEMPEVWQRLSSVNVGRLATSVGALPVILPVNFVVHDHRLVFAIAAGSILADELDGRVFAFEASGHDTSSRRWWSVLVRGRAVVCASDDPLSDSLADLALSAAVVPMTGESLVFSAGEVPSLSQLPGLGELLTSP